MDTITEWLPRPTARKRVEFFQKRISGLGKRPVVHFSEFLRPKNILFFHGNATKMQVVEALAGTLQGQDLPAVLQSIWSHEREGALGILPDISILRGRLGNVHHIRAALGICPNGVYNPSNPSGATRVFVLFVGPNTQTRLHARFLVAASALFHNRRSVEKMLRLRSSDQVLEALRRAEGIHVPVNPMKRFSRRISDFFRIHYGWGDAESL